MLDNWMVWWGMQYPGNEKFLQVDENTRGRRLDAVALGLLSRKESEKRLYDDDQEG